jgi:aminopeptidase N
VFDNTTYSKGFAVVQQLVSFLGKQAFINGIREYIKAFSWKNASSENLKDILIKHSTSPKEFASLFSS